MEKCIIKDEVKLNNKLKKEFSGYGLYDTKNPVKEVSNRYYLELKLNSNKEAVLVAFMINPSDTLPENKERKSKIDATVKNLINVAYKKKYSKLIVLNLYPLINPKQIALKNDAINNAFIKKFLSKDIDEYKEIDLLIACGHDKDKNYADEIKEIIKNYKEKFNKIFYLSINIDKFSTYIEDKILHPAKTAINPYGGVENLEFREFKL